jgi:hypothetical protein
VAELIERAPRPRWDRWLRVGAALFGTLPAVLLGASAVARTLPMTSDMRFALAFILIIPAWVGAMCAAFLARSGVRALLVCGAVCGALTWPALYW